MNLSMQTALANLFAVGMTFAVLTFPNPTALFHALYPFRSSDVPEHAEIKLPAPEQAAFVREVTSDPEQGVLDGIKRCTQLVTQNKITPPEPCLHLLNEAAFTVEQAKNRAPGTVVGIARITRIEEALNLAASKICREEWSKSKAQGVLFDAEGCKAAYLRVASAVSDD